MRARFFPPKTFEILAAASRKVNLFYLFDLGFTFCIASCLTRIPSYAYSRRSPYDHAALLLHDLGSRPRHSLEEAFSSRTGRIASRSHRLPATETQCLCSPGRRPSSRASSVCVQVNKGIEFRLQGDRKSTRLNSSHVAIS